MALPKQIIVTEKLSELKTLLKKASPLIGPRLRVLIEIKKHEKTGISKRELARLVGVDPNSVQTWRTLYAQGGLSALQKHKKTGFKPSVFTPLEHLAIEKKLKDPANGLRGYSELLTWVEHEFKKQIKYNTLLKYSMRNFGSKIKVARKSHIKKDEQAVSAFKKTLVKPVNRPLKQSKKGSKK
jgi:transposase